MTPVGTCLFLHVPRPVRRSEVDQAERDLRSTLGEGAQSLTPLYAPLMGVILDRSEAQALAQQGGFAGFPGTALVRVRLQCSWARFTTMPEVLRAVTAMGRQIHPGTTCYAGPANGTIGRVVLTA